MTHFFDLFANDDDSDRAFDMAAAQSHLRSWKPGAPITDRGTRVLVGVATWSGYDMRLLDVIDEALGRQDGEAPRVEVFNASYLPNQDVFEQYIPGLPPVFHTPVVGVWRDGILQERAEGYNARELVARMFGSSSDEIVDFIDRYQAARAS
jgi:hypothetical protein